MWQGEILGLTWERIDLDQPHSFNARITLYETKNGTPHGVPLNTAVIDALHLQEVKEVLGHKDIKTTLRYVHLSQRHLRSAVESLNGLTTPPKLDEMAQRMAHKSETESADCVTPQKTDRGPVAQLDRAAVS